MKKLLFLIGVVSILFSCNTDQENKKAKDENPYAAYFYPTDSLIPYIYVYQNINQPLDEKVHRIYRTEDGSDTSLVVEYYNSDLKITEGFTHSLDANYSVIDHMIVDGDGKKRQAKLTSNTFFPSSKENQTQFISDFPSHLDSITMIYQSKRRITDENVTVKVFGKDVEAIIIEDSVKVLMANPFTQKSSSQKVKITRTFAKGYGLVRWSANEDKIVYELDKIWSNKWWEDFAQSPQINL